MLTNATFFTIVSDKYHTIDPLLWSFRKPHQQTKTKKGRNWYKSEHNHSSGWELWDSCHPLGDPTDLPAVQGGSTLRRTAVLLLQTVFWMLQAVRWLLCLSGLVLSPPHFPVLFPGVVGHHTSLPPAEQHQRGRGGSDGEQIDPAGETSSLCCSFVK